MNLKSAILSLLTALILLWPAATVAQEEVNDNDYNEMHQRLIYLYNATDYTDDYHQLAEQMADYYRGIGDLREYYKTELNVCLYDADHDRSVEAMKRANDMLENIKEDNFSGFCYVYYAMAYVYESRGCYRMAVYYYRQSLEMINPDDHILEADIFLRLANLLMFREPIEAEHWIKRYRKVAHLYPQYEQVYLFLEASIRFSMNDIGGFKSAYMKYMDYRNQDPNMSMLGEEALKIANLSFEGRYGEALAMLSSMPSNDMSSLYFYDMRIIVCQMMKRYDLALEASKQRAEAIDSINADMIFANITQLNAQIQQAVSESEVSRGYTRMLIIALILAVIIIGLVVYWGYRNRHIRKVLNTKNEQLHSALAMAEEGEKMKTEFVRSVSHEIRTPLNAINGFNELLNTPGIDLEEEERQDLLERIRVNVQTITDIVDEMLRVADKESNEFSLKADKIYCNQFLQRILDSYREKVSSSIELKYSSRLLNRFQIQTNQGGLEKIVRQLLDNAVKFTKRGSIELSCSTLNNETMLLIAVTDTGKGVSEEKRGKIFDGFYKEDSFEQGIGLGLTVSKKVAQKLGGDLVLDEEYNDGARFLLKLPVA